MMPTLLWWLGLALVGWAIVLALIGIESAAFWLIVGAIFSIAFALTFEIRR